MKLEDFGDRILKLEQEVFRKASQIDLTKEIEPDLKLQLMKLLSSLLMMAVLAMTLSYCSDGKPSDTNVSGTTKEDTISEASKIKYEVVRTDNRDPIINLDVYM